jgi:O-methyltransferase
VKPDPLADQPPSYDADFLRTWNKSVDFLTDPRFMSAYRRGMDSGHAIGRAPGSRDDIHIEWRIHTCCWAAAHAVRLPGDFVECGTNTGIMSLAVCDYVDFNSTGKRFFLFDTFAGIPVEQISERERALGRAAENAMYPECWEIAQKNFAPFPNARLIRGRVPETLSSVEIGQVCYLCIDMNIAEPEIAAMQHFWPRLVPGAPVIFDDYGWLAYRAQKEALDEFARSHGVEILLLPTGQGLLIKS